MSFTGDSDDPPACNSEPWQPVKCFMQDPSLGEDLCEKAEDREYALDADGNVLAVAGYSCVSTGEGTEVFIWTPEAGMENLLGLLFGYDLKKSE